MVQDSNFDRVMEARNHFKNEASLSQISRRFFLRTRTKGIIFALFALLWFTQFSFTQAQEITEPQIVKFGIDKGTGVDLTPVVSSRQKEHLEPAEDFNQYEGIQKEYYDNLFPLLYSGFTQKPYARYASRPSFSSEYAFSVEEIDGKFYIISNRLSEKYRIKTRDLVKVNTTKTEINNELYLKIGELFELLAEQTKEKKIEKSERKFTLGANGEILETLQGIKIGFDGTTYSFTTTNKNGEIRTGTTWSPHPRENPMLCRLVDICDNLCSLEIENNISQTNILKEIETLIIDLKEKRYGIESAILKRNTVVKHQDREETISSIQYFADYGSKEQTETFSNMDGQLLTIFTIIKHGYIYQTANINQQGVKINMTDIEDVKFINFLDLTDELKKKYQVEEKANEQFLGKDCQRYDLTFTTKVPNEKISVWIWQGLILKSSTTIVGRGSRVDEVTEIQEGAEIAKEKFELPDEGVNFRDLKP